MRKLAAILLLTALAPAAPARAATTVHLQAANFRFCVLEEPVCTDSPFVTTISVGQTVDWTYNDKLCDALMSCGHDIRIEGTEGGPILNDGPDLLHPAHPVLYSRTFTVAGTYRYWCSAHKNFGMLGTIVAQ